MKKGIEAMKMNQSKMKNTIFKMKNTLEGVNSRLNEDRISHFEEKIEENT